jgi:MoaA/NifB/PqqE/SkfB family radical SAM enzyme
MNKLSPKDATIAITYKCNSRCRMCNIWQIENPAELPLSAFRNLSPELRYVNLSGGEPFLRTDIVEIVKIINEVSPNAQIIFSSNGFATETIIKRMEEIKKIDPRAGIRISLDGIGEMHAEVRGIPGAYDMVMKTIAELKRIGISNLGFSFTIMDKNVHQLREVYELSQKLGVELALAVVQNSDIYFQKADNKVTYIDELKKSLDFVIDSELSTWSPKHWGRAFYDYGLKLYAEKEERLLPSGAGFDSLFIDPSGIVYPSNLINLEMGNILETKLDTVWQAEKANAIREQIRREHITESWIICTIRGEMKKHLLKAGIWAATNKLRVMFGGARNLAR